MADEILAQMQYFQFFKGQSGLTLGITDVLHSQHSPYQHIQVCDTDALGRVLLLNGILMFSEHDEFVYHEMLVHTAMGLLGGARRALIIGGGDGGTLREVLRYPQLEQVDEVEIDQAVIDVSQQYFPAMSAGFADQRVRVFAQDGIQFVKRAPANTYDLIIIDGTDPIGFGQGLYTKAFYKQCARLLTARGVLVTLSESPFDPTYRHMVRTVRNDLRKVFPIAETFLAYIPTYQTGMFSFAFASKQLHPVRDFKPKQAARLMKAFAHQLRYYNPETHLAAFVMPNFVRQLLEG